MNDWAERWQEGRIGFHQDRPNWALQAHGPTVFSDRTARVLVPLAGKSLDMVWLESRGHEVVGVELVPEAVRAFFENQKREPEIRALDGIPGQRFEAGRIALLAADMFQVDARHLGPLGAAFDRAALIALPEAERSRYMPHVVSLLDPGAPLLLVTLEYDQASMNGPPYSVGTAEVERLFDGRGTLEKLDERDALLENPRFRERGLRRLEESVFVFRKSGVAADGRT